MPGRGRRGRYTRARLVELRDGLPDICTDERQAVRFLSTCYMFRMGPRGFIQTGNSYWFSPNNLKHAIIPNYQGRSVSVPWVAKIFAKQIKSIVPSHSSPYQFLKSLNAVRGIWKPQVEWEGRSRKVKKSHVLMRLMRPNQCPGLALDTVERWASQGDLSVCPSCRTGDF